MKDNEEIAGNAGERGHIIFKKLFAMFPNREAHGVYELNWLEKTLLYSYVTNFPSPVPLLQHTWQVGTCIFQRSVSRGNLYFHFDECRRQSGVSINFEKKAEVSASPEKYILPCCHLLFLKHAYYLDEQAPGVDTFNMLCVWKAINVSFFKTNTNSTFKFSSL